jgi:hypothetical protein
MATLQKKVLAHKPRNVPKSGKCRVTRFFSYPCRCVRAKEKVTRIVRALFYHNPKINYLYPFRAAIAADRTFFVTLPVLTMLRAQNW